LAAGGVFEGPLAVAYFEPITAVDRFDIEDVLRSNAQHALDWRGHVLVHSVGELDHHDGALTRGPNQATGYGSRSATELPEHDLHRGYSSKVHG
jgi:hypothetical protein